MSTSGLSHPPADLRSRNVARNRADVADVALGLFEEHGFDAVTIDDIAAAAGISRRTFFRYFESKEGAVLPFEDERLELLREALTARPAGEPLLVTIRRATLTLVTATDGVERTDALRRMRIVHENPSVHARSLEVQYRWEEAVRELVADHLGADPATSVAARIVAAATIAAMRAAAEAWVAGGGDDDLADLLAEAYEILTAGLTVAGPADATRPGTRHPRAPDR